MYVDFALIAYDDWVVAPPGYEAYQCSGKCFYPFGDHLSPTKHAIVQTLVHGALQGQVDQGGGRPVGRACCVPTRLAPTSLLYLDAYTIIKNLSPYIFVSHVTHGFSFCTWRKNLISFTIVFVYFIKFRGKL